ncbi:MAG: hypothetical protein ACD_2C00116G0007 [uncultured bacterium (gcode 4)]|uniref:Phosphatidic acid phosphatase type 2/haloperoxidase domain-containing protein n=1 Tax=uncultured bacterium (gcode 4) TaxID=1234023 RepID=K2GH25_9BACT|nr:MAG: hypothetical protein ACD_2C00116G0007 [uncultured bacterium (gcode 4)]
MLQYLISLDVSALNLIMQSVDQSNTILVNLITFFSDFGVFFVALTLVGLWLFWTYTKNGEYKRISLSVFYTIAYSFIFYIIINKWFPVRPRPETVSSIRPLIDHLPDNSFPSWHAIFAGAAIIWFALFWPNTIYLIILSFLSVLMFYSRIASWVHYPWDILMGALFGILFGLCFYRLQKLHKIKDLLEKANNKIIKLASYIWL